MKGQEVIARALTLLGYRSAEEASGEPALLTCAAEALRTMAEDVLFASRREADPVLPSTEVPLDRPACEALVYGVAMMIAQSLGDSEKEAWFASVYDRKRRRLSPGASLDDAVPTV